MRYNLPEDETKGEFVEIAATDKSHTQTIVVFSSKKAASRRRAGASQPASTPDGCERAWGSVCVTRVAGKAAV